MITLRLTPAQQSALECRGLHEVDDPSDLVLRDCWNGRTRFSFDPAKTDEVVSALIEHCNCEDATAEYERSYGDPAMARFAANACRALSNLCDKVSQAGRQA